MSTETQTRQKTSISGIRKKPFAVPPVKVACLSCRSSRIRCDGKEPCSGCNHRGKECVYVQSRRGGARVPRSKRQNNEKADYVKIAQECFDESVPTMVKPGAGLTQLDLSLDNTDNLFDSIFTAAPLPQPIELDETPRAAGSVRIYQSDSDILDAYYIWLHPFFPILPPSEATHPKDNPQLWFPESSACTFEPRSPASLAISAILALIPHPEEGAPFSEESIKARREAAHHFAKRTIESIECDSEMPDSSISPAQALVNGHSHISRPAFHSRVPVELESVIALSILSVYEYAQRGNITKMRDRASQALMMAMNLSLHDRGTELDGFAEARRRIWWMTYICVCQASIVSSAPPAIPLFDSRFTTSFPQASDPEAWPFFIKSQQTILLATQFVSAVGRAVDGREDWTDISTRMQELHNTIEPLIAQANTWTDIKPVSTDSEAMIAYSLKQMSKIKLNRYVLIHKDTEDKEMNRTDFPQQCKDKTPPLQRLLRHPRLQRKTLRSQKIRTFSPSLFLHHFRSPRHNRPDKLSITTILRLQFLLFFTFAIAHLDLFFSLASKFYILGFHDDGIFPPFPL
ncbi:hypothetical protein JADG_003341 [Aureobasidium aubasidani]|nr:hypothetical protein JADG_003341 [Aureobasidium pullulans]